MGRPDVYRMLEEMPSTLFAEWLAFDDVEPISLGWRGDVQAARIASLLANIHRDRERKPDGYTIADFMPDYGGRWRPKPARELYDEFRTWAMLAGAKKVKVDDGNPV